MGVIQYICRPISKLALPLWSDNKRPILNIGGRSSPTLREVTNAKRKRT